MATPDEKEKARIITRFRELFHGRFDRNEVRKLLENHDWIEEEMLDFVMTSEPKIVTQLIHGKTEADIARIQSNVVLAKHLPSKCIPNKKRQFACESCDNVWWARVPKRKPVSKCKKCPVSYDPIPFEEEWGKATFECGKCGNEFTGFGQMNATQSQCYKCKAMVYPSRVDPPTRRGRPRSNNRHSCSGHDCFNRHGQPETVDRPIPSNTHSYSSHSSFHRRRHEQPDPASRPMSDNTNSSDGHGSFNGDEETLYSRQEHSPHDSRCTHPKTREGNNKPRVIIPSTPHRSTGSTVASLILDDDELSSICSEPPNLSPVPEDGPEDAPPGAGDDPPGPGNTSPAPGNGPPGPGNDS